ncbi:feruloyl esterase [Sphingobium sp. B1D7B]|nr:MULTISPECIES: tannase/feruloyl esterase family alpha/beta hydrolase [unclassified Sphingobium]MCW2390740.1 feruloyl esterase [Sphingobium sp. B11D3A]MCW2405882.1 feruloyl esterase [Sphingobium sp. B1D7B]
MNGKSIASLAALLAGAALAPTPAAAQDAAQRCAALTSQNFGAEVKITSAMLVPAGPSKAPPPPGEPPATLVLPEHCRVDGVINQRTGAGGKTYGIGFALALPKDWSGRFLLMGGGGLNGSIREPIGPVAAGNRPALSRGFAVLSHDSGHKGAVFDNAFMIDQRATLDFAESSVRTVTLAGKAIAQGFYGKSATRSYMTGCSTGGREGMLAAQRYPELFDGIVVGAPAMRTGNSNLGMSYAQVMFNQAAPKDDKGTPLIDRTFSPTDRQLILKGLLNQCDGLDGLKDGMIENVGQCRFQPARLQCTGAKADSCLSKAQVEALERAFAGPRDKSGYPLYAPVPFDTGIVDTSGPVSGYITTGAPGVFGPPLRDLTIDLDARINEVRNNAQQRLTDTSYWTNLNTFLDKGSKILFFHGVSDPWFSAWDTWDYWLRASETNDEAWDKASRFYMVPGMAHCGGGNAFDQFDLLGAVVDWVEQGKAPEGVTASRRDGSASRPLCPFPGYARYTGGDATKASSFTCTQPDVEEKP